MLLTSFVYREENPSFAGLDAVWAIDVRRECSGPVPYLTLPDGCVDLIYRVKRDFAGKIDCAELFVAGPTDRAATYFPLAGEEFVGVRFAPGWGGGALGLPASELVDGVTSAKDLTAQLARLENELFACESKRDAVTLLRVTGEIWADRCAPERPMLEAVDALRISGGQLSVETAAHLAGMSARSFRRKVAEAAGLPPKTLSRIFRFRRALNRMEQERLSLSDLALRAGYADQAHMTREFRALGGFTPGGESGYFAQPQFVGGSE